MGQTLYILPEVSTYADSPHPHQVGLLLHPPSVKTGAQRRAGTRLPFSSGLQGSAGHSTSVLQETKVERGTKETWLQM